MADLKMIPVYPKSTRANIYNPETDPMRAMTFEECAASAARFPNMVTVTPIEPTDAECEAFVRQAWKIANQNAEHDAFADWHKDHPNIYDLAIARHALKQIAAAKGTK